VRLYHDIIFSPIVHKNTNMTNILSCFLPNLLQAFTPVALLLLEQMGGQPHQEVGLQREGALRHAPAALGDSGEGSLAQDEGAVRRCALPPTQVISVLQK